MIESLFMRWTYCDTESLGVIHTCNTVSCLPLPIFPYLIYIYLNQNNPLVAKYVSYRWFQDAHAFVMIFW